MAWIGNAALSFAIMTPPRATAHAHPTGGRIARAVCYVWSCT
jgi:hypothetical protein